MRSRQSHTKKTTTAEEPKKTRKLVGGTHKRRKRKRRIDSNSNNYLICFIILAIIMCLSFVYQFTALRSTGGRTSFFRSPSHLSPHLYPPPPILPIFPSIPSAPSLIADTLSGHHPTIAGIIALLQQFLSDLHKSNIQMAQEDNKDRSPRFLAKKVIDAYMSLVRRHLTPFDETYRNRTIFDVRDDGSLFISLAAYREHLLGYTLRYAFREAKYPDRLFVGVVVQNCFGKVVEKEGEDGTSEWIIETDGLPCKTGMQVVGKDSKGRDTTKISDAPPDSNGIEEFCTDESFKKYCDAGQVRVIYVHETESMGPAMARYLASKLWGGETYFMQMDSHLRFAKEWDDKYIKELKATKSYPKSILSAYPPDFDGEGDEVIETEGSRNCRCYNEEDDPDDIVRITAGKNYKGDEPRPTQIPFMAAGFIFTRAEFLKDVPFDPFMPWVFMGEEILLSTRSWTHGWNIYAPRKNLIKHQYRPGRMGLPKYWESVGRFFHRPQISNFLANPFLLRVKYMVGYENVRNNVDGVIDKEIGGWDLVTVELDNYGMGQERTLEQYLKWANMHPKGDVIECKWAKWCDRGELE